MEGRYSINGIPSYGTPGSIEDNKGKNGVNTIFGFGIRYGNDDQSVVYTKFDNEEKYTYIPYKDNGANPGFNKNNINDGDNVYIANNKTLHVHKIKKVQDNITIGEKIDEIYLSTKPDITYTCNYEFNEDKVETTIKYKETITINTDTTRVKQFILTPISGVDCVIKLELEERTNNIYTWSNESEDAPKAKGGTFYLLAIYEISKNRYIKTYIDTISFY